MTNENIKIQLSKKQANGYVIALGPINLVSIITDIGMVACGAYDVAALDKFSIPAAKCSSPKGPIANIDDLLNAQVKEANASAINLGIKTGMTGKEALELM